MKKAFTLSELIVAIGIVGVIAAMTTPFLSGLFPDGRKIQVLKAYRIISDINAELLSDPSIYQLGTPVNINGTSINNCIGLMCEQRPLNPEFNNAIYEGADKYANLLMTKTLVQKMDLVVFILMTELLGRITKLQLTLTIIQ